MRLFRVCPWLATARVGEPGHPLFVPRPQSAGRIANPDFYSALYLGDTGEGAVAEAFGNLRLWTQQMFEVPSLPGSVRALCEYDLADGAAVFDLDNGEAIASLGIRPSDVVTRAPGVTQAWALRVFKQDRWSGIRWWSYYDARWHSFGLWDLSNLAPGNASPLDLSHPAVIAAADVLLRPLVAS